MILIVTQSVVINSKFWFKALPIKIPEIIQPPIIQPSVQKMQIQFGYLTFISQYRQFSINNQVKAQCDKNISDLGSEILYCSPGSHQSNQSNDSYMPILYDQISCMESST